MRISPHEEPDDADLQAPPELVLALKRLPQERLFVPPTVDEAVVRAARQHLADVKSGSGAHSPSASYHWWQIFFAASAVVLVLALVVYEFFPAGAGRTLGVRNPFARETSGSTQTQAPLALMPSNQRRLDILDAFALARQLKAGPVNEPRWDVNHDGTVDDRDVRTIAREAVRLDKGGRS